MEARMSISNGMRKWLGVAAPLSLVLSTAAQAQDGQSCQQVAAGYNYALGTQAFGAPYQFSKDSALLEQAREIRGLGSNLLKISLSGGAAAKYGIGSTADGARTTLEYVMASPELQQALDMDFVYYQAWVHSFNGSNWRDGVSKTEAQAYYDEMYELSAWLLSRYSGTGKVFMLGNWEGDWLLQGRGARASDPSPKAIEGMIDWLNIRQKAIDDAKAATGHENVELYHYVEVNLVKKAMEGKASVAHSVLPATNVDMVSYSSYEAIKQSQKPDIQSIRQPLTKIVQYLEGQLQPKSGLPFGRRVFIGEYGYHADQKKPLTVKQQYAKSRYVMQVAIELELPFALIWQLYNNEYEDNGTSKEMSLINEAGHKRALYYLHLRFLRRMNAFVLETCKQTGRAPSRQEFKAMALDVLPKITYGEILRKTQDLSARENDPG